ncbi:peptidase domain-containing ABC transporter [Spirosoma sp.]|uniref:peptidase domain-containing ABC transporter n=1 Tax=Spirosoma sp. TaxID=1899569 RepID=UPI00262F0731|nr:peptidase domain-containing ABC transporter [Spirosoma sp.]MCX6212977.1 peptidase domain-containing ABC transporter [Spirosoma sp.]
MKRSYKFHRQLDYMDCGPTCLKMVASHFGREYSLDYLRAKSHITRQGVSLLSLSNAAEQLGFKTLPVKLTIKQLNEEVPLPCILHWNQEHFVVLYDVHSPWLGLTLSKNKEKYIIADPGHNLVAVDETILEKCWLSTADQKGVALLLEPTADFYNKQEEGPVKRTGGFAFLFQYLIPYRSYLLQIVLGMIISSLLLLVFPFLTQSLVDHGIQRQNFSFIHLVLGAQLVLFAGSIGVDLIRNWILLHINTRISVTIISNFLLKLMKLPISFFEAKNIGDITQRISDHKRIEHFLTGSTLNTLFSLVNLLIFSVVLGTYNLEILYVFLVGSGLSLSWILLFLKRRKELDYARFQRMRENQNSIYEMITGMPEIKLNNCERARRWDWERIQAKLFKISIKSLALEQYQEVGSSFLTQLKNIIISYLAAMAVIHHEITLGIMLSVSYIVGQMNGPLAQLITFIRSVQDAKISLERLSEIHDRPDEELDEDHNTVQADEFPQTGYAGIEFRQGPLRGLSDQPKLGITLKEVSFRYGGPQGPLVINQLNLHIPQGKVTAIVGASGSGKTTLLKLLLKFYQPSEGEIQINGADLNGLSARSWRKLCGTVMQDGYIFSDTIVRNIAVDGTRVDGERLANALHTSNLDAYVKRLPLGLTTKIGSTGSGLSGGQRQRVFIARAVYKNPKYLFFDEATSALDANNEKVIMENLDHFFEGRTVIVIAHRLSTVKSADQIVVMDQGRVKEQGTHNELIALRGQYFELVKNQLEIETA